MNRCIGLAILLVLYLLMTSHTQAQVDTGSSIEAGTVALIVIGKELTENSLKLNYKITNGLEHDIWICETISTWGFEVYLEEDGRTLIVRRRLDVPSLMFVPELPSGRYIRLGSDACRLESLWLPLPIHLRAVFSGISPMRDITYPEQLRLEIGYYVEDLPVMIRTLLGETRKTSGVSHVHDLNLINMNIKGPLYFNMLNEGLPHSSEQVVIPYTDQGLKGEQVMKATVKGLRIPYIGIPQRPKISPPDIGGSTRIEVRYEPSMLEYFFPYQTEYDMLSAAEVEYLHSLKTVVINDPVWLKALAKEINRGFPGGISSEHGSAHVVCYHDSDRLTSFTVYDDMAIITEQGHLFSYCKGLSRGLQSLRESTPQIRPFDLRITCAANLRDLWHRLRVYSESERLRLKGPPKRNGFTYPKSSTWCDDMMHAYVRIGMSEENILRAHQCPAAGEDKNNYALNSNCKPDSPPDMVLLFETKTGWNQHGGPKLFTFDNHDPKGGCVLLNDGTVKFIRTKEELQRLRWK